MMNMFSGLTGRKHDDVKHGLLPDGTPVTFRMSQEDNNRLVNVLVAVRLDHTTCPQNTQQESD